MTKGLRAWQLALAGLLGILALPAWAVAPKTAAPMADSGGGTTESSVAIVGQKTPHKHSPTAGSDRGASRKAITRQPEETPEQLGARVLPAGAHTITKPLEFELPPLGKVVLVLYERDSDDPNDRADPSIYRGFVLIQDGKTANYRIEQLPSQQDGFGTLMYDVQSVFAADADGDGAPELCILSEIAEVGAGDNGRPHTDTDLFKWTGSAFTLVRQSDKRLLYNLRDAKAVRAKLKKMHGH